MNLRFQVDRREKKIDLQMTAMIDIVFQLLVFFVMTFQIVPLEGDFSILLPQAGAAPVDPPLPRQLPLVVRLTANPDGSLASIYLGERQLSGFDELNAFIIETLGDDRGPRSLQETAEVELNCDENLHYEYTIHAMTAVSGYKTVTGRIAPLVKNVRLSRPPTAGL